MRQAEAKQEASQNGASAGGDGVEASAESRGVKRSLSEDHVEGGENAASTDDPASPPAKKQASEVAGSSPAVASVPASAQFSPPGQPHDRSPPQNPAVGPELQSAKVRHRLL